MKTQQKFPKPNVRNEVEKLNFNSRLKNVFSESTQNNLLKNHSSDFGSKLFLETEVEKFDRPNPHLT